MKKILKEILKEEKKQTKILQSIESKLEDKGVDVDLIAKGINQHQQRIYQADGEGGISSVLNHDHTKALQEIGRSYSP